MCVCMHASFVCEKVVGPKLNLTCLTNCYCHPSGGVGLLLHDCWQARTLKDETEGLVWVEVILGDEGN